MTAGRSALVTGAGGQVGRATVEAFARAGWMVHALDRAALDVTDPVEVAAAIAGVRPVVVVNLAAWTDVDGAEADPSGAMAVNASGVQHVADAARRVGARLCHISTEHVFDGTKVGAYVEVDPRSPRSAYGRSKAAGEALLDADDLCVRTSWVAGVHGANTVKAILGLGSDRSRELAFVDDQRGCPTGAVDLAVAIERLVSAEVGGVVHVTNARAVSWYELAVEVLDSARLDPGRVRPIATHELVPPRPAPRPANGELAGDRLRELGFGPLRDHRAMVDELVARLRRR